MRGKYKWNVVQKLNCSVSYNLVSVSQTKKGGHCILLDGISTGTVINALFVSPMSIFEVSTPVARE